MITQACYKGRYYQIQCKTVGTASHGGSVIFGGIPLASWSPTGCGDHSIEEALETAHRRAEALNLTTTPDPE